MSGGVRTSREPAPAGTVKPVAPATTEEQVEETGKADNLEQADLASDEDATLHRDATLYRDPRLH